MGIPYIPKITQKSSSRQINVLIKLEKQKKIVNSNYFYARTVSLLCGDWNEVTNVQTTYAFRLSCVVNYFRQLRTFPIGMTEWLQREKSASNKTRILSHLSCRAQT